MSTTRPNHTVYVAAFVAIALIGAAGTILRILYLRRGQRSNAGRLMPVTIPAYPQNRNTFNQPQYVPPPAPPYPTHRPQSGTAYPGDYSSNTYPMPYTPADTGFPPPPPHSPYSPSMPKPAVSPLTRRPNPPPPTSVQDGRAGTNSTPIPPSRPTNTQRTNTQPIQPVNRSGEVGMDAPPAYELDGRDS